MCVFQTNPAMTSAVQTKSKIFLFKHSMLKKCIPQIIHAQHIFFLGFLHFFIFVNVVLRFNYQDLGHYR